MQEADGIAAGAHLVRVPGGLQHHLFVQRAKGVQAFQVPRAVEQRTCVVLCLEVAVSHCGHCRDGREVDEILPHGSAIGPTGKRVRGCHRRVLRFQGSGRAHCSRCACAVAGLPASAARTGSWQSCAVDRHTGLSRALDPVSPLPIDCGLEPHFRAQGLVLPPRDAAQKNNVWGKPPWQPRRQAQLTVSSSKRAN